MSAAEIIQASAKNTIFGRYLRSQYFRPPSLTVTPTNILTSTQGGLDDADQTWTAGDTYLFSSTMVNQFRGSVRPHRNPSLRLRLRLFLRFGRAESVLRICAASEHLRDRHGGRQRLLGRARHGRRGGRSQHYVSAQ